jgi:hypothetical protein
MFKMSTCGVGLFLAGLVGLACSNQSGLHSSGGTTASGGNTAQGGSTVSGGRTGQGGTTAVGGTMTSGGTSASGTGGASGSGGSQGVCSGRPSTCFALCQGGECECYCPSSGGAGGSSTATGGNGGITGTGGASSSSSGNSCYDSSGTIATTAKTCTLASDCKQVVQPTCCGYVSEVGLSKSSSCTFPAVSCGDLGCTSSTYQQAEDGKNTAQGGSIGVQCVSGQCMTFVMAGSADAGADAGPCPAGQNWCPGCTPGTGLCLAVCGAVACPPPDAGTSDAPSASCAQVTTQAACDSRSDCHSVFLPGTTCGCAAAGCCELFNRCADGGRANCTGPVACLAPQPVCVTPYAPSYTNVCYEGCVLQSECAGADAGVTTPTCPSTPPTNASSCGSTNMTCFYDNCPSTGRTQATCAGGAWIVQIAACGTVSCTPIATSGVVAPKPLTCPSGQVCLVTGSGNYTGQCIENACGQGPVTAECGTTIGGCVLTATLTSGVTITCNTCPQGGCP